jgi:hypothetical protein
VDECKPLPQALHGQVRPCVTDSFTSATCAVVGAQCVIVAGKFTYASSLCKPMECAVNARVRD